MKEYKGRSEAAAGGVVAIIILSINVIPVLSSFGRQASHQTHRLTSSLHFSFSLPFCVHESDGFGFNLACC